MTLPKVSTMVTFRQRRCELVDSFVATYRREVGEALELLFQDDGTDEPLAPGTLESVLERMLHRMRRALSELLDAERAHLDEVANDAVPRQRRDRAAREVRQLLLDLRQLYRAVYGKIKATEAGFERRIANDAKALLRQGERVYGRLSTPDAWLHKGDEPARLRGLEVAPSTLAAQLETPLEQLRSALDEVTCERAKAQGTKVAKDRALRHFDDLYLLIVRMLVPAFRLAGMDELADRLPTSLRRPSRRSARPVEPV